jgi:hypothetical protein
MTGSPPPVVKLWTFCEKKCATTSSRQRFDMDSGKGHSESAVPVRRRCTQLHLFRQMDALRILTPDDRVPPSVMDATRGKGIRGDWVIPFAVSWFKRPPAVSVVELPDDLGVRAITEPYVELGGSCVQFGSASIPSVTASPNADLSTDSPLVT